MTKPSLAALRAVSAYIRAEADFNRSWTDGRRSTSAPDQAGYIERRRELAAERDAWADAIDDAIAELG